MLKKITFLALMAISCSKDDAKPLAVSDVEININFDKEHQYTLKKGSKTLPNSSIAWVVNDKNIGDIDANGMFKARKVGSTFINATYNGNLAQANVNVVPYSKMLVEPVIKFGSLSSDIKYLEKRKLLSEKRTSLIYQGENSKIEDVIYLLENDKMVAVGVYFTVTESVTKEAILFYEERYPRRGPLEDKIVHFNDSRTYTVLFGFSNLNLIALYMPFDPNKRTAVSNDKIEDYRDALLKLKTRK